MPSPSDTVPSPPELPELGSVDNLRDVAGSGEGYPTRDGGRVRRGVFYRANLLRPDDDDLALLTGLGLRVVHDLRRADEVAAHPDRELPGAEWRHVDVLGVAADDALGFTTPEESRRMMEAVYRDFVHRPSVRDALARVLRDLASDPLPQLFHCTAGKDRTGWVAVLLLHLAGVEEPTIRADYLLSNERTAASRARYERMIVEGLGEQMLPVLEPVLVVTDDYLDLALGEVAATYSDLDGYLRDGLGLPDDVLDALRERLVAA
nr:tyrosine-protein phosphatase [Nocardioides perillae]